jgi:hypothetical protein
LVLCHLTIFQVYYKHLSLFDAEIAAFDITVDVTRTVNVCNGSLHFPTEGTRNMLVWDSLPNVFKSKETQDSPYVEVSIDLRDVMTLEAPES